MSDDVAKYELTRMEKNGSVKKLIASWTPISSKNTYKELSLSPGNSYQYKITVYDSAGNSSEDLSRLIYFETGYRDAISSITVAIDRKGKESKLIYNGKMDLLLKNV